MKVVGGPLDGREVELLPYQRDYFALKRVVPGQELVTDFLCSEIGRIAPVRVERVRYTVRTFSGEGGGGQFVHYNFLAPDDWSDMQALRHQFSK